MKERGGVQSIERAFAIVEEVARHREGIRLGALSRRVGLHTSTAFHLVKTMLLLGYLRQMPDDKTYRLGTPLFRLAASCLDEVEMTAIAKPILEDLSVTTGESSHFAIRSGDDIVVLARTAGSGAFQLMDRVGAVRPAHCTALGKILLAALDDGQLEGFLARRPPVPLTPRTITGPERLAAEIAAVRRTGIAYDDGEFNAEARCVAVPVHDFTGEVRGAIGISGAVWRLSLQALEEKSRLVCSAAARMSAEFGRAGETANGETPATQQPSPGNSRARRQR
ncbi:MAG TPA: IclR family transcriptional regulator [Hyphomicrobiaceae bacterium]|jgi:DNA-binding IclR family transcriptional regulator